VYRNICTDGITYTCTITFTVCIAFPYANDGSVTSTNSYSYRAADKGTHKGTH